MIYILQREINSFCQESLTITMYHSQLKKKWDELECLAPTPHCTCHAAKQVSECDSRNKLMQFLMGLNDAYDSTRDQILLIDPMPMVSKAYSMILQMEKQKESPLLTELVHIM